jgi:hypothetical protein
MTEIPSETDEMWGKVSRTRGWGVDEVCVFKSLEMHDTLRTPGPQESGLSMIWISSKWPSSDASLSIVELKESVVSDNTHFVVPQGLDYYAIVLPQAAMFRTYF